MIGLKRTKEEQLEFCKRVVDSMAVDFNRKLDAFQTEFIMEPDADTNWSVVMRLLDSAGSLIKGAQGQVDWAIKQKVDDGK